MFLVWVEGAKRETWEAFDPRTQQMQQVPELKRRCQLLPTLSPSKGFACGQLGASAGKGGPGGTRWAGWVLLKGWCPPALLQKAISARMDARRGRWDREGLLLSAGEVSGGECFL